MFLLCFLRRLRVLRPPVVGEETYWAYIPSLFIQITKFKSVGVTSSNTNSIFGSVVGGGWLLLLGEFSVIG